MNLNDQQNNALSYILYYNKNIIFILRVKVTRENNNNLNNIIGDNGSTQLTEKEFKDRVDNLPANFAADKVTITEKEFQENVQDLPENPIAEYSGKFQIDKESFKKLSDYYASLNAKPQVDTIKQKTETLINKVLSWVDRPRTSKEDFKKEVVSAVREAQEDPKSLSIEKKEIVEKAAEEWYEIDLNDKPSVEQSATDKANKVIKFFDDIKSILSNTMNKLIEILKPKIKIAVIGEEVKKQERKSEIKKDQPNNLSSPQQNQQQEKDTTPLAEELKATLKNRNENKGRG